MFALALNNYQVAMVFLSVVAVVALIGWLLRKDDQIERRRKMAADASKVLAEEGYEQVAEACNCYAVGDYSGFLGTIREIVRQLLNPETRLLLLRKPFRKQFVRAMEDAEERSWVLKQTAVSQAAKKTEASQELRAPKVVADA